MEDIDGGLHPAVDGQSLDEMRCNLKKEIYMQNNMVCMPLYFLQLLDTFFFDLFYVDTYTIGR